MIAAFLLLVFTTFIYALLFLHNSLKAFG
jgi:hypothetical protein